MFGNIVARSSLMVAVSKINVSNISGKCCLHEEHLGIVTPAFSQACISAEPAVANIRMIPISFLPSTAYLLLIPSFHLNIPSVSFSSTIWNLPTNCKLHLRPPRGRRAECPCFIKLRTPSSTSCRPHDMCPQHHCRKKSNKRKE